MTSFLLKKIAQNPRIGVAFGLFFAVVFGSFGLRCLQELRAFSAGPVSLSMEDAYRESASREIYVRLTDMVTPACENAVENDRRLYIPLRRQGDQIDIVAVYETRKKCEERVGHAIEGTMKIINPRSAERLQGEAMNILPETRSVCTNCGVENSRLGVIVCGVLFLCALAVIPLGFVMHKKYLKEKSA